MGVMQASTSCVIIFLSLHRAPSSSQGLTKKQATKARIKGLRSLAVKEGKTLRLSCRIIAGNPQPSVTWYKDGKILKTKNITESKKKKKLLSKLEISSVKSHDGGEYECVATNVLGNTSMKAKVTVVSSTPQVAITTTPRIPSNGEECRHPYKDTFCLNGGTCMMFTEIQELAVCQCADGYTGPRCENRQAPLLNKKELESHVHNLTVVVVILGVLLCVTVFSIVTYFIFRTKRKMQREREKASSRRLSRGGSEKEISNGDTIEMLPFNRQISKMTETISQCTSKIHYDEPEVKTSQSVLAIQSSTVEENEIQLSLHMEEETNLALGLSS